MESYLSDLTNDRYDHQDAPCYRGTGAYCGALFASNKTAPRARGKKFREGPTEAILGVMSTDWNFMKFKSLLARSFKEKFPPTLTDDDLLIGDGIPGNVDNIRHVSGYYMRPGTYPLASNTRKRKDAGLTNRFKEDWVENLYRAHAYLLFSDLDPVAVPIKNGSSSCIPYFTNKIGEKLELAETHLNDAQAAGELVLEGKFKEAWETYQIGGANYVVYRGQASDKIDFDSETGRWIPKPRMVADLLYAATSGRKGRLFEADKTLIDRGFEVPSDQFAGRLRTAFGAPFGINIQIMMLAHTVRSSLYRRFPKTFHNSDRANKKANFEGVQYVFSVDQTDHDINWWNMKKVVTLEAMADRGFAPWYIALYKLGFELPSYLSEPAPDHGSTLIGRWDDPAANAGLPSGRGDTDIMGTFAAVDYLIPQIKVSAPHLIQKAKTRRGAIELLTQYYAHVLEIRQQNKGDDARLGWFIGADIAAAVKLKNILLDEGDEARKVSPHAIVGVEKIDKFLGDVWLLDSTRDHANGVFIGDERSYIVNYFCHEYSIDSHLEDRSRAGRPYAGLGHATKNEQYGGCKSHPEVVSLVEDCWARTIGGSFRALCLEHLRMDTDRLNRDLLAVSTAKKVQAADLSPIELEVLISPEKLFYKYTTDQVRPEVLDLFFSKISVGRVEQYINQILPGG